MTAYAPAYRLTVYKPRSVDSTESNVLVGNGTVHSDNFQVTTLPSLSGWKPYLTFPQGRKSSIDFLARKTAIGQLTVNIIDQRTTAAGSNLSRWVTGFFSGASTAKGRLQLLGNKVLVEESLDGGATWANDFTGRIVTCTLQSPLQYQLTIQGMSRDLTTAGIFVGRAHSSVSYYSDTQLLPPGPSADFGLLKSPGTLLATADDGTYAQIFAGSTGVFQVVLVQVSGETWNIATAGLVGASQVVTTQGSSGQSSWTTGTTFQAPQGIRVRMTFGGNTGEFLVFAVGLVPRGTNHFGVAELVIGPLPSSDPFYLALPTSAVDITDLSIRPPTGVVSADAPMMLADAHPVQVLADILDGKFGYLTAAGAVAKTYPRNSSAFSTLIADTSFGVARFVITAPQKALDWIEKNILQPFGLVIYENASGEIVPVDVRLPTSLSGLSTLQDDDLDAASEPQWSADATAAISVFDVKTYVDTPVPSEDLWNATDIFPAVPTNLLATQVQEILTPFFGPGDATDKVQSVDAQGLRSMPTETINGQTRLTWVGAQAAALAETYRRPYATGPLMTTLTCRRTSTVTALTPGAWVLVALSKLPDPSTNVRGGTRLMRVVEKSENVLQVTLVLLDAGPNATAAAPTVGTLAAGSIASSQVQVPITLNANSDPVQIQYAVTPAGTSSAPATGSNLWTMAQRVTASGTYPIGGLAEGSRIFIRAQSLPNAVTYDEALPSSWATAATPYYDTTTITAPTSLVVSAVTTKRATLTWSVGSDTRHIVRVLLANGASQAASDAATPVKIIDLPAGSLTFDLQGLDAAGPWYHPQIQLIDGVGGVSSLLEASPKSFQATGTADTAPGIKGIYVLPVSTAYPSVAGDAVNLGGPVRTGVALSVVPETIGYDLTVQEAPDVSGSPGTYVDTRTVPASRVLEAGTVVFIPHPLDGTTRWYRAYLSGVGVSAGSYSTAVSATPGLVTKDVLQGRTIYPVVRAKAMDDGSYAALANDQAGAVLADTVVQTDGASVRAITKGVQRGTAKHGDVITFAPAFQNTPQVRFNGGILYEPRSKWGAAGDGTESGAVNASAPQYENFAALGLTASGFTVRARLRQRGATTKQDNGFAGTTLSSVGGTDSATLTHAPASTDQYQVTFAWTMTLSSKYGTTVTGQLTVAIEASNDGGSTWVAGSTSVVINSSTTSTSDSVDDGTSVSTLTVSGLTTTDKIRLRIVSFTVSGVPKNPASFTVIGDTSVGVEYFTATDSYACKTPASDADVTVDWEAYGYV